MHRSGHLVINLPFETAGVTVAVKVKSKARLKEVSLKMSAEPIHNSVSFGHRVYNNGSFPTKTCAVSKLFH